MPTTTETRMTKEYGIILPESLNVGGGGVNFTSFSPTTAKELFDNADRINVGSVFKFNSISIKSNYYYPKEVVTISDTKFITRVANGNFTRNATLRATVTGKFESIEVDGVARIFYLSPAVTVGSKSSNHTFGGETHSIHILYMFIPDSITVRKKDDGSYTISLTVKYINLTQVSATTIYTPWFKFYQGSIGINDIPDLTINIIE